MDVQIACMECTYEIHVQNAPTLLYGIPIWNVPTECVCGMYAWNTHTECMYGMHEGEFTYQMHVPNAHMECMYGMYLCAECIYGMHVQNKCMEHIY